MQGTSGVLAGEGGKEVKDFRNFFTFFKSMSQDPVKNRV